jgi:methylated-DNA-[protein]-cysteine S-methyltransferase
VIQIAGLATPVGPLTLAARNSRICALFFGDCAADVRRSVGRWYGDEPLVDAPDPAGAASALHAYFAGNLAALDGIDVEMNGTPFQQRVWQALRTVQPGQPVSYSHIARLIDAQSAVRAVGAANGANPVAIIVPCHRIIGANGQLTGYGGGIERKRWLLNHEAVHVNTQ